MNSVFKASLSNVVIQVPKERSERGLGIELSGKALAYPAWVRPRFNS